MVNVLDNIPKPLRHHFIRGYFDGDGCISSGLVSSKKRWLAVSMLGTYEFLEAIRAEINLSAGKVAKKPGTNVYKLSYHGKNRMFQMKDYLYKNASVYFPRKFDKFIW
jgi:intein-encoded DNA endonuclease-like protein